MEKFKWTILFCLAILISSCQEEDYSKLITGAWFSTNITINGIQGNTISNGIDNSIVLSIGDNSAYYRNYVTGSWSLDESTLSLSPEDFYQLDNWDYEIIELTENKLKVRIELTENEYGWNFSQFEEDELLTIIETYDKEN